MSPRSVHVGAVLVLACWVATSVPGARAQCCPPRPVVETQWPITEQWIPLWLGADALGGVQLISESGTSPRVFRVSVDDGETWASPGVLNGAFNAAGDVDPDGRVVLTFVRNFGVQAAASADQGLTFSPAQQLMPLVTPGETHVDIGPGGVTLMTWHGSSVGVTAVVSPDRGETWMAPRPLPLDPSPSLMDARGIVTENALIVAWVQDEGIGVTNLYVSRSLDLGQNWSTPIVLNASPRAGMWLRVASTSGGHAQVLYPGANDVVGVAELWVAVTDDDGATWSDARLRSLGNPNPGLFPTGQLTGHPDGRVHATWDSNFSPVGPRFRISLDHGFDGTWLTPYAIGPGGDQPHDSWSVSHDGQRIDIIYDDYRDDGPACPSGTCESVYVDSTCDGGASWQTGPRLDDDTGTMGAHSEIPLAVVSSTGRVHAVWREVDETMRRTQGATHAGLDRPLDEPRLTIVDAPAMDCASGGRRVEVIPESVAWCAVPAFEWFQDGVLVPGVTGSVLDLPSDLEGLHEFHVVVQCADGAPCGDTSVPVRRFFQVSVPPDSVADTVIDGVLRVEPEDRGDLLLSWQDARLTATAYSLYAGTISSLFDGRVYDHVDLACHVARVPSNETDFEQVTSMPSADTYYLVAPADCFAEGSLGDNSLGMRRPTETGGGCGPAP